MNIFRFEIAEPYPALYWREKEMLILSDLHLGVELIMARRGMLLPRVQLDQVLRELSEVIVSLGVRKIMIVGDLKHEFSKVTSGERKEIKAFIERFPELVFFVVRGNHDTFLVSLLKQYVNVSYGDYFVIDGVCFLHGHEENDVGAETYVIGHEHPAVMLRDPVGIHEKIPCFLFGCFGEKEYIVLPAFSPLSSGTPVNGKRTSEVFSPFLRSRVELGDMKVVGIDREAGVLPLPELKRIPHE